MQTVWLLVVAAVLCGPLASVDATCKTPWKDCGSTDIKIDNVIVENCCDDQTCKVDLGKNTSFSFTFTPDKTYPSLNQSACGELGSLCAKFPDEKFMNMCDCPGCVLSAPCPFKSGTTYNITVPVPLPTTFPKNLKDIAKWQIFDSPLDKTKPIGCFELPIETN